MNVIGWPILTICLLTGLSLFFSLNTLAIRTFSRLKLQEAFTNAGKQDRIDEFLALAERLSLTCGFFRLLASVGILLILAHLLADKHYILTFAIAVIIQAPFTLSIPHSWSKHAGEYILPRTYPILKLLYFAVWPVLFVFELNDRLIRRLAGIPILSHAQDQEEKQEQILSVVEQGKIEGVVDAEEVEMIENVLEMDETTAEQIMTPRTDLVAVSSQADMQTILKTISQTGHSRIPVFEKTIDSIVGILYAKDLLEHFGAGIAQFKLPEIMRKPYFVPESKPMRSLLHEFKKQKLHIAVVLDEYGGTAGVVTIEDILEQLVGEITDEFEQPESEPVRIIDPLTADVDARIYIDDLNSQLELNLPEDEDYDTLGGFVFSHLGYIPKVGQQIEYGRLRLTITAAEPRSVKRVRIQKPPTPENSPEQK